MSEPILADRCAACGTEPPQGDDNGWYIDANGNPRCPDCEASYRRVAGKLANLASEAGDGATEIELRRRAIGAHDCMEYAVPITTDGPIGHGWECGKCGKFLQAG